ncbi:MAG: hypothetical protein R2771_10515 [Saprospiraceae bacterium]
MDNNPQADATGDRAEWDMDFSGGGNLYISPIDRKIHLFGAEKGYWRIDQQSLYFQGWQGWRGDNLQPEDFENIEPDIFGTIEYLDTDNNGFMDKVSFDMDGDKQFEVSYSLLDYAETDVSNIIEISDMEYSDYYKMFSDLANNNFKNALDYLKFAESYNLNTEYYSFLLSPKSLNEKYNNAYWLKYYILQDLLTLAKIKKDKELSKLALQNYFK